MSIAVLHHLSTLDHRLHALRELVRVTRVGGEILVCAWAVEQGIVFLLAVVGSRCVSVSAHHLSQQNNR